MSETAPDPRESRPIFAFLDQARRRIRMAAAARGTLTSIAAWVGLAALSLGLDRIFRLGVPARALLLALYAGGFAWFVYRRLLRPLLYPLTPRLLADMAERLRPELQDRFRSAVDFLADPAVAAGNLPVGEPPAGDRGASDRATGEGEARTSGLELAFKRRVIEEAQGALQELKTTGWINHRALRNAGLAGGGAALFLILLFVLAPAGTFGIWFRRNILLGSVEWPYRTRLLVEGFESGRRGVPQGDSIDIAAKVEGEVPDHAALVLIYPSDRRRQPMFYSGERSFRCNILEVREPFEFYLEGGDYRSPRYRVDVLERPRLASLRLTREFPPHTGLPPETGELNAAELAVPAGTLLKFAGDSSKNLTRAWLEAEGKELEFSIPAGNRRALSGEYRPRESCLLTLRFIDFENVIPDAPTQIQLQLVPDRPPIVKLKASGIGSMVSAMAQIPLAVEASDDYRIESIDLSHRALGDEGSAAGPAVAAEGQTRLAQIEPGPQVRGAHMFQVGDLHLEPEKRLILKALAADNDALSGPHTGSSAALEFLVVTQEKLLDDFLRRQEEQRRAFERIIQRESSMRDAIYESIDGGLKKEGELEAALSQSLAANSREERTLASQCLSIAGAIDAILVEMGNNRIGEVEDLRKLGLKVVEPLREVAQARIPEVGAGMESLRAIAAPADRVTAGYKLAEQMEALIKEMEAILASMNKLEGFSEVVKRLRGLIQLQNESSDAARKSYERLLQSIFEEEKPPAGGK